LAIGTEVLEGLLCRSSRLIANGEGSDKNSGGLQVEPAPEKTRDQGCGPAAGGRKIRVLPEAGAAAFPNAACRCPYNSWLYQPGTERRHSLAARKETLLCRFVHVFILADSTLHLKIFASMAQDKRSA